MPVTFRKSFWIFPGVRLNLGRNSRSFTFGFKGHGPHYTRSSTGRRTTSWDLPGPFGFRHSSRRKRT
ncbi:DUF4236 domain-containing protein [Actinacidiphila paucisporea]|uniref:DUF4236 domain-containing protein n=1 Tax=Actinacidiphila paucisporea TaxID=310782 RepID=A0A1M6XFH2_9ACTN|nr:DUF4236 domain-containing protein [Actinacidiphila paucisporea]SHL04734.1 Protein of unknown function [Actinacidiphila paucisporea]